MCRCCVKRRKRQKHQAPSVKRSSSVKGVKRLRTRQLIPARLAIWKQEQAIRAADNFERESRAVPSYRYIIRAFACKDRIFCARNTSSACAQTATTDAHTRRGGGCSPGCDNAGEKVAGHLARGLRSHGRPRDCHRRLELPEREEWKHLRATGEHSTAL